MTDPPYPKVPLTAATGVVRGRVRRNGWFNWQAGLSINNQPYRWSPTIYRRQRTASDAVGTWGTTVIRQLVAGEIPLPPAGGFTRDAEFALIVAAAGGH